MSHYDPGGYAQNMLHVSRTALGGMATARVS